MTTTTGRKGGGKSAAARAEKKGKARIVKWEGVELETPEKLPGTLALDIGRIEVLGKKGEQPFGAMYELLESLIGEEGIEKVRSVAASRNGTDVFEVFTQVMTAVFEVHGSDTGESSASAPS